MQLTKDNIKEWLAELNVKAEPHFGKNFADCITEKEWLEQYEGETVEDCIQEEIYASQ